MSKYIPENQQPNCLAYSLSAFTNVPGAQIMTINDEYENLKFNTITQPLHPTTLTIQQPLLFKNKMKKKIANNFYYLLNFTKSI